MPQLDLNEILYMRSPNSKEELVALRSAMARNLDRYDKILSLLGENMAENLNTDLEHKIIHKIGGKAACNRVLITQIDAILESLEKTDPPAGDAHSANTLRGFDGG